MTADWVPQVKLSAVNHRVLREGVLQRINSIANVGQLIDGPEVTAFEERWAGYVGARYCVGVGNGTDALELAVRGALGHAGLRPMGLPALSFVATAEAAVRSGEDVYLIDVDPVTLMARTDFLHVAVGLYGQRVEMIEPFFSDAPPPLVVDAAQMHGQKLPGVTASWSFYPTKNLGAWGDAGAVTTDDEGMAEGIRELARHGGNGRTGCGFNSRLDSIQAAVLIDKLDYLDGWVEARRQAAGSYRRRLKPMGLDIVGGIDSVFHQVVVRVPRRNRVLRLMLERHVECGVHYPLALSEMEWLMPYRDPGGEHGYRCPVAEAAVGEVLSLPLWPGIETATIDRVVNALGESLNQACREEV